MEKISEAEGTLAVMKNRKAEAHARLAAAVLEPERYNDGLQDPEEYARDNPEGADWWHWWAPGRRI